MTERADAHIHLFEGGYQGESFVGRPGVEIDEVACYASLAKDHHVQAALVVGYSAEPWATANHLFLTRMAAQHDWIRPVTYVEPVEPPTIEALERFRAQGFIWLKILQRHGELRLIVSHLGLPPRVSESPPEREARRAMADVLALAEFPEVRVKLSGFYALTDPGYDYPHRAAWPYVEALLGRYSVERLLWASDFSPCLDWVTFPQTFDLFSKMPFLSKADRSRIEGGESAGPVGSGEDVI
jgi:L-fuconolactonase